jgi:hypothetical protein
MFAKFVDGIEEWDLGLMHIRRERRVDIVHVEAWSGSVCLRLVARLLVKSTIELANRMEQGVCRYSNFAICLMANHSISQLNITEQHPSAIP